MEAYYSNTKKQLINGKLEIEEKMYVSLNSSISR